MDTQQVEKTSGGRQLVGFKNFKRHNPKSDHFKILKFHHIEFFAGDANNVARRFSVGLGMQFVAKSDQSTGNQHYCSYVLQSSDLIFAFTAPYSRQVEKTNSKMPLPYFNQEAAHEFFACHGLAVKAVGVLVSDAEEAYKNSVANGAIGIQEPVTIVDEEGGKVVVSEIQMYKGAPDVALRWIQMDDNYKGPFLPGYKTMESFPINYGIDRLDHVVGNVPQLMPAIDYLADATGLHEFAEFTAEDVGTVDSGLNSMVLANNNEMVLLPMNEPTFGTPRKSQIQTYLEQNEGPGVQHLALKCEDIFATMRHLRKATHIGGFEFMPPPSKDYYKNLPEKIGDILTPQQYKELEELGLLADKDDQGVLLQIFSKPVGDRMTIFVEIIQRVGCSVESVEGFTCPVQRGGCGGFGKGNFSELFKSIEDYEKTLDGTLQK